MAREQVTFTKVTDDVTGIAYQGNIGEGGDVDKVLSYRVTIIPLNASGNPVNAEKWTRDVDMHTGTHQALTAFIDGGDKFSVLHLILSTLGVSAPFIDALWTYATTSAVDALRSLLGVKATSTSAGKGKRGTVTLAVAAKMWHVEQGTMTATPGRKLPMGAMPQDKLLEYVNATGATADNVYGNWTPAASNTNDDTSTQE